MNGRELIHKPYFWLVVVGLVWLATSLPSLMTYPAPYTDEWLLGSISVSLLESGRLDAFYPDIFIYKDYSIFRLYNIGLALTYKLFGAGLIQGRLFSMAGAFTGGVLVYWLGNKLYNPWVGISAAALYWLSPRVLWLSHVVRPDMWVNVGELILLIVFWKVQLAQSKRLAFVLGALAIGLLDIYLPVVFISLAVSCAMAIRFYRPEDWKFLFVYGAGCSAGLAFYVLSRFTPEGQLHAWLPWLLSNYRGSLSGAGAVITHFENTLANFIEYSRIGLPESACYLAGLIWLVFRRKAADGLLLIATVWGLAGTVLMGTGPHHLVYLMPVLGITTAAGLAGLGERLVQKLGRPGLNSLAGGRIPILIVGPLALAYVVGGLFVAWQTRLIDYAGYEEKLRSLAPAHSRVLGEGTWWGSLREVNFFFVEEQLVMGGLPIDADNPSLVDPVLSKPMTELIRLKRIDTLLIDEGFTFMRPGSLLSQTFHEELLRYALSNCRLAGVVEGYMYGYESGGVALKRTEVYRCP